MIFAVFHELLTTCRRKRFCKLQFLFTFIADNTRAAPDIISGPGRNPAKFSYPAGYEAGYEVGFDHLSMHLLLCAIGQKFIVLRIW